MAAALLPLLLHRLNNASQVLSNLGALLALDARAAVLESRSEDLSWSARMVDETGWLLGLCASACGADLLLDRRERDGLEPLVRAVRDVLRREGLDLADPSGPLPDLHPAVEDGWQLPWGIAGWLWVSARSLPPRSRLEWSLTPGELRCSAAEGPDDERLSGWMRENLPGARLAREGRDRVIRFPAGWLLESARRP